MTQSIDSQEILRQDTLYQYLRAKIEPMTKGVSGQVPGEVFEIFLLDAGTNLKNIPILKKGLDIIDCLMQDLKNNTDNTETKALQDLYYTQSDCIEEICRHWQIKNSYQSMTQSFSEESYILLSWLDKTTKELFSVYPQTPCRQSYSQLMRGYCERLSFSTELMQQYINNTLRLDKMGTSIAQVSETPVSHKFIDKILDVAFVDNYQNKITFLSLLKQMQVSKDLSLPQEKQFLELLCTLRLSQAAEPVKKVFVDLCSELYENMEILELKNKLLALFGEEMMPTKKKDRVCDYLLLKLLTPNQMDRLLQFDWYDAVDQNKRDELSGILDQGIRQSLSKQYKFLFAKNTDVATVQDTLIKYFCGEDTGVTLAHRKILKNLIFFGFDYDTKHVGKNVTRKKYLSSSELNTAISLYLGQVKKNKGNEFAAIVSSHWDRALLESNLNATKEEGLGYLPNKSKI